MANTDNKNNIDSIITFVLLKKIVTPIVKTKAFKLGLVDNTGRNIKKAETESEKNAYTLLDKLVFKLKRLLGSKQTQLHNFLYLQTLGNDFTNKLIVRGSVENRAEIMRITKDIEKISEKYSIGLPEMLKMVLNEELQK